MNLIKIFPLFVFLLGISSCHDKEDTITEPIENYDLKIFLSLENLKKALPASLLSKDILIFVDENGKEVEIKLKRFDFSVDELHPTGVKYQREISNIHFYNEELRINTSLIAAVQLAYGNANQTVYDMSISDNNWSPDPLKNRVVLSFLDTKNIFVASNLSSLVEEKEVVFRKEFSKVYKSKTLKNGEAGVRYSTELGVLSLLDPTGKMYILKVN
jgi:hypothetical protein